MENIILLSDSYKTSHYKQYPPNTEHVYSYFESRGGEFDEVVFFGLQYFLKEYLTGIRVTESFIREAKEIIDAHMGPGVFNEAGWKYIISEYEGKLPIIIKALPEGTITKPGDVLMSVENTDPRCYWLTNYLETLLVQTWYPTTIASLSRGQKKTFATALYLSGDISAIDFKIHDFGFRGVTCPEQAGLGGLAHLVNVQGTDTLRALLFGRKYYNIDMPGYSINAAEHSTITSWENESDAFENMLTQYPTGLVAVVSDSYNIYDACENLWGTKLKEQIIKRDGTLVIRPDSGDPSEVCCKILDILWDKFGGTMTRGFKVLDPHVRIIQGDGINRNSLGPLLRNIMDHGFSADNIAVGSGGGLLQDVNRDTCKFAFKCSDIKGCF
jgi:nicotinamide phosphoribosyltransferase